MSSLTVYRPPLIKYTEWFSSPGSYTPVLVSGGSTTINRDDTVRRPKPKGDMLSLIKAGTNVSSDGSSSVNAQYLFTDTDAWRMRTIFDDYPLAPPRADDIKLIDDADLIRNSLLAKVKGDAVNLANMVGEYKQAADLFASSCKKIYHLAQAVIKRDPRILVYDYFSPSGRPRRELTRRARRDVGRVYLELVYGVLPLAQDMDGVFKAMKHRFESQPLLRKYDARIVHKYENSDIVSGTYLPGRRRQWAKLVTSGVAVAEINRAELLRGVGQYGFTNPLSLAWELTPFSFVIDWWINVGEVLSSLDNPTFLDNFVVQVSRKYQGNTVIKVMDSSGTYTEWFKQRDSPSTVLYPYATLHLKPKTSLRHIANGIALLTQLRR